MSSPEEQSASALRKSDPSTIWRRVFRFVLWVVWGVLIARYLLLAPLVSESDDKDWSHLWLGGRMIASGHASHLYDPELQVEVYRQADPTGQSPAIWGKRCEAMGCFNYPPPAALAYATLAWLPMRAGAVVNAYLTLALALITAWLFSQVVQSRASFVVVSIAILAYPPFFTNLSIGQNAVVTTTIVVLAWYFCNKRQDLLAGLVLGLLVCKPNWLLAVGWIPLIHGRWRVLAGMTIGSLLVVVGTALAIGAQPFSEYLETFRKVATLHELPGYRLLMKCNGLSVFRKWFGLGELANWLGWISCVVVAGVTWKATWRSWQPGTPRFQHLMACCVLAALWINPHLNHYDLLLVAFCIMVLGLEWRTLGQAGRIAAVLILTLCYVALPWDEAWTWRRIVPVPSLALLTLWGWFIWRLHKMRGYGPAEGCFVSK